MLENFKLPSLKDKHRALSNEELEAEVKKLKEDTKPDKELKVEKPKAKKKK